MKFNKKQREAIYEILNKTRRDEESFLGQSYYSYQDLLSEKEYIALVRDEDSARAMFDDELAELNDDIRKSTHQIEVILEIHSLFNELMEE